MNTLYRFIFSAAPSGRNYSTLILILRILFGLLLMWHGVLKWANYDNLTHAFPDPLGLGGHVSLLLVIFAELFCSIFFMFGFFYRIVLIPMIFSMSIAFFVIHGGSIVQGGELAFTYLAMFLILFFSGPGRISFDYIIFSHYLKK